MKAIKERERKKFRLPLWMSSNCGRMYLLKLCARALKKP